MCEIVEDVYQRQQMSFVVVASVATSTLHSYLLRTHTYKYILYLSHVLQCVLLSLLKPNILYGIFISGYLQFIILQLCIYGKMHAFSAYITYIDYIFM